MSIRIVFIDGTEDAYPDGMYPLVDGLVLRIKSGPSGLPPGVPSSVRRHLSSDDVSVYPLQHIKRWDER